jgi:hypothetical protein
VVPRPEDLAQPVWHAVAAMGAATVNPSPMIALAEILTVLLAFASWKMS